MDGDLKGMQGCGRAEEEEMRLTAWQD